ncbi:23S rRNA (adenine(2030)-N(6))-methyltransferase RlmJ [Hoeflea sp. TYP-13]|uniref:23S rRNA (adenine(2030)-N(6))-methyltransferase RlmJ n=1 Tax=Hoeflea sp. TYP-13 TaxID=3230023 RepID=UPI0034C6B9C4
MNYRHIYHAGNFADVLKHLVLARIVTYLKRKEKAFRVVDTHAGAGMYDLGSEEAQKTGEWQSGIGRLVNADLPDDVAELLAPYLSVIKELNPSGKIERYPGSPKLVRALFRKQDRLSAIELHPQDAERLKLLFEGDYQTRVTALDGWLALGAHLPPKERRGLVLVDPPFEKEGEYDRLVDGLARACGRWQSGSYCLWYPIKKDAPVADFHEKLKALGVDRMLCAELSVCAPEETTGLSGSGVILVNPPYTLEKELKMMLPELVKCLRQSRRSGHRLFWLTGE